MANCLDILNHMVLNPEALQSSVLCDSVVFVDIVLITYVVEFVVEAAGVAHRVSVAVASPQRGRSGLAVCTAGSSSSRCRL